MCEPIAIVETDLIPTAEFGRMKIVLSLGGSVLMRDFNADRIRRYAEVIERIAEDHKVFVVVGGGKVARSYINTARELGADNTFCDYIGIGVTRLNAMLLCSALKKAPKKIPKDFIEAYELSLKHDVVVMGGTFPGHTTDATSALLAEFVRADLFLNATAVDGVYTDDPKKNPNAKKYEKISARELIKIVTECESSAGGSFVLDLLAAKIIERSKIKTIIFLGEPENIERVIEGDFKDVGTLVEP
jgi:uridylate kinase